MAICRVNKGSLNSQGTCKSSPTAHIGYDVGTKDTSPMVKYKCQSL